MIVSTLLGVVLGLWAISRRHIACYFFGHRPAFGYGDAEGQGYFKIQSRGTDGINRHHAALFCECERCGDEFQVGNIHIPQEYVVALDRVTLLDRIHATGNTKIGEL